MPARCAIRAFVPAGAPLFTRYWIATGATFRHPVWIHRARGATLSSIRIAGARNSKRRLTGCGSWICRLRLACNRLPILSVRFLNARILGVGTCTEQYRCRRQNYYRFHRMPPLYNFRFNSERGKKCRSCVKFRANWPNAGGRRAGRSHRSPEVEPTEPLHQEETEPLHQEETEPGAPRLQAWPDSASQAISISRWGLPKRKGPGRGSC
jgi:hypothetical protein